MKIVLKDDLTGWVDNVIQIIHRSQLQYNEYSFISIDQLKEYYKNKIINQLSKTDTLAYAVVSNQSIIGVIICEKEVFDTENFGFDCFRISDLLVFSSDIQIVNNAVNLLVGAIEDEISRKSSPYYLNFSLNNNCYNFDIIFNCLVKKDFYFIHTLLTFGAKGEMFEVDSSKNNEDVIIRDVTEKDVVEVGRLAQSSFYYSRFHLDPFLDNAKAGALLKRSAENSILNKFVDIMYVAEINGTVVGYYSAKKKFIPEFNMTIGDAVISAVDSRHRGKGIFSKLDARLLNWFAENTDFAEMGTYLANSPIHKSWINKKLRLIRGVHVFSKYVK